MNFLNKTFFIAILLLGISLNAYANPQGENVVAGSATFNSSTPNTLTITTASNKTIINYNSFSIASNESTIINQPNANSATLNRVVGVDPSEIYGNLSSNGKLFLVNPNGILFGLNSRVNAPAILASTLDISNNDFLNGNYNFFKNGGSSFIINQGRLAASPGGYIALLSQAINNQGVIIAPLGTVALAAGDKITLALDSQSQISVAVDDAVKTEVLGPNGQKINSAIENSGTIKANGGKVLLTARILNDVFDYAVNNSGVIEAKSLNDIGGSVQVAATGAPVMNTGKIQSEQVSLTSNNDIYSLGELESSSLIERGNTFQIGGIFNPGIADIKNADNALVFSADTDVSGTVTDGTDIIIDPTVTLTMTGDTNFVALTGAFTMDSTATINGGGYNLSISADSSSTLGNINNVNLFTLNSNSGSNVNFTSNASSTFQVNTVQTNYLSSLSRTEGTGTALDPVMIYSDSNKPGGLEYINTSGLGLNYELANNINAAETSSWSAGFTPIGTFSTAFTGTFNGNGDTIANLFINASGIGVGLFGNISDAIIKNVGLIDVDINANANRVGGLVGNNYEGTIENSFVTGSVSGEYQVGGLVGDNEYGPIENCYSTANVISGSDTSGTGGLVGVNDEGTIINSYATGSVSGSFEVGGLVGENQGDYYGGSLGGSTIINSFASGVATSTGDTPGGLIGENDGSLNTLTNNWWYNGTNSLGVGSGNVSGVTEAASAAVFYNPSNPVYTGTEPWDITTPIWNFPGGALPILAYQVITPTTYVWLGGSSSNWLTASNWLDGAIPGLGADITIDDGTYNPVLPSDISVTDLVVDSGAVFNPSTFTISGANLDVYGTLLVTAPTFAGNYSFTGTRTLETGSTVNYTGTSQTIASALTYYNLIVSGRGTTTLDGHTITANGNITIEPEVTIDLSATTSLISGNAFTMDPSATIAGGGNYLSISALNASTLGDISNVAELDLSLTSGSTPVTFTLQEDLTLGGLGLGGDTNLNGGYALIVTNDATFDGTVGLGSPLTSIFVGENTNIKTASITTSGPQDYNGEVNLGSDTTLTGNGITFGSDVEALFTGIFIPYNLTINDSGTTTFDSPIEGTYLLNNLVVNAADIDMNGGVIQTVGSQTYNGTVTLSADTTLAGDGITFKNTIDSSDIKVPLTSDYYTLTIGDAGETQFEGAIGSKYALGSLNVTAFDGIDINGGSIVTSGLQTYESPVALSADTVLTGSDIDFVSTLDGAFALTIHDPGTTTFGAAVGSLTPLTNLDVTASAIEINGPSVKTNGSQAYNGAVTLNADTVFTGDDITFNNTVDSSDIKVPLTSDYNSLTINDAGETQFNGAVGGNYTLGSLNVTAPDGIDINGGSIKTSGAQTLNGPVTLSANTLLTGNGITFKNTIDSSDIIAPLTSDYNTLTINDAGETQFDGTVGSNLALGSLDLTAIDGIDINGGSIKTNGVQFYTVPVTLGADTILTGGGITFEKTVDGGYSLTINDSATTTFDGEVGGTTALTGLDVNAANIEINTGSVTTSGAQIYSGPVTMSANTILTGDDITFNNTVDCSDLLVPLTSDYYTLTINDAGETQFNGVVGSKYAFSILDVIATGGIDISSGSVVSNGQYYNGPVTLNANTILTGNYVSFESTLNGTFALTINGQDIVGFGDAVGSLTPLTSLEVIADGIAISSGSIVTSGPQIYKGGVILDADVILTGDNISFYNGLGGNGSGNGGNKGLTINDSGTTTFNGVVGGGDLSYLVIDATDGIDINGGSITTSGLQKYNDPVILGAATILTGTNIEFTSLGTLNGAFGLTINDSGRTIFGGAVGSLTPLTSLYVTAANGIEIDGGLVVTSGLQDYTSAVALGADTVLTGKDIDFVSTLDGTAALTINDSGTTYIAGAVGSLTPLTSLDITANMIELNGGSVTITTSGAQTYNGAVTLSDYNTTLTGDGMTFNSTIDSTDGYEGLTIYDTGTTTFNGEVGSIEPLSYLTVNDPITGNIVIDTNQITTSGAQYYDKPVTLEMNTTLTGSAVTIGPSSILDLDGYNLTIDGSFINNGTVDLTVTGITAANKTYDGTTNATIDTSSAVLNGTIDIGSNLITLNASGATGAFNSADAGIANTVTVSGLTLNGAGSGLFTIIQPTIAASITPAPLTVTASNQTLTYGNSNLGTSAFTSSGLKNGETIGSVTLTTNATTTSGNFNVGTWTITPGNATGGTFNPGNYSVNYAPGTLTVNPATVTATLTVKGITADNKVYNGTTNATLNFNNATLVGVLPGDKVNLVTTGAVGTFTSKNVGNGITVDVSGLTLSGANAANYVLVQPTTKANITPAPLTITAKNETKTYGTTLNLTGDYTVSGLIKGDTITSVTLTSTGAGATAQVAGSPYSITPSAAKGTGLSNYTITYVSGKLTVKPAILIIKASNVTKLYGTTATLTKFTVIGLVNGNTVTHVTLTSAGASAKAKPSGDPYSIIPSGAVGTGLSNYIIIYEPGILTVIPEHLHCPFESGHNFADIFGRGPRNDQADGRSFADPLVMPHAFVNIF